jgi:hypothetical protein
MGSKSRSVLVRDFSRNQMFLSLQEDTLFTSAQWGRPFLRVSGFLPPDIKQPELEAEKGKGL